MPSGEGLPGFSVRSHCAGKAQQENLSHALQKTRSLHMTSKQLLQAVGGPGGAAVWPQRGAVLGPLDEISSSPGLPLLECHRCTPSPLCWQHRFPGQAARPSALEGWLSWLP